MEVIPRTQTYFDIWKSINTIPQIDRMKDWKHTHERIASWHSESSNHLQCQHPTWQLEPWLRLFQSSSLLMQQQRCRGLFRFLGLCYRVKGQFRIPGSWLHPGPSTVPVAVDILGLNQKMWKLSFSLIKQIDILKCYIIDAQKEIKIQYLFMMKSCEHIRYKSIRFNIIKVISKK